MTGGYALIFGCERREPVRLDRERQAIRIDGSDIALSPREFAVMAVLVERAGRVVPRRAVLRRVWGDVGQETGRCLNVYLSSLRRKLERDPRRPQRLHTVRGRGLYFEV